MTKTKKRDYTFFIAKSLTIDRNIEALLSVKDRIAGPDFDWNFFIRLASDHFVVLSLYQRFRECNLLDMMPEGLAEHLQALYEMNDERNSAILRQIERINKALNAHNITPVYIKGTANLMDGLYSTSGERVIGDIDFLVEPNSFFKTAEILMEQGYYTYHGNREEPYDYEKHYSRLTSNSEIADVEVHRSFVFPRYAKNFNYKDVFPFLIKKNSFGNLYVLSDFDNLTVTYMQPYFDDLGLAHKQYIIRVLYDSFLIASKIELKSWFCRVPNKKSAKKFIYLVDFLFDGLKDKNCFKSLSSVLYKKQYVYLLGNESLVYYVKGLTFTFFRIYDAYFLMIIRALKHEYYRSYILNRIFSIKWLLHHFKCYGIFWAKKK